MLPTPRLLCLLLCTASAALADETVTWVTTRDGREVARETARDEALEGGGRALTAVLDASLTPTPWHAEARLELDAAGRPRAYRLESGTHTLSLQAVPEGLRLSGTVVGHALERTFAGEHEPPLVLDNLFWSHYDALGRRAASRWPSEPAADLARVGSFGLALLVPQAGQLLQGRFTPRPGERLARQGQTTRRARRGELTVAALLVQVDLDAEDGRVYRVEVPAQSLLARRQGWELEEMAGGAPGPEQPAAWREEQLELPGPHGPIGATLCLPRAAGRYPAALLLPGSGPQDRDETIGPNKPLRDLARALAARGLASLRCDKRTWRLREEVQRAATAEERQRLLGEQVALGLEEEYLADARAAVAWLRQRPEVRPGAVLVIGHSLGALVAPELASASQAAGVVLLAGPGRPMIELLEEQLVYQATLAGTPAEQAAAETKRLLDGLRRGLQGGLGPERVVLGATIRYWKDVHARDLPALLRGLSLPVLALAGAEDCQVRPVDLERLRAALEARQGAPGQARLLPGRNHLFQAVEGPSTGAEYYRPAPLDPAVAEAIAAWWREVGPKDE